MPDIALFANFENPFNDTARALHESIETVVHAEQLGFEQVWLTEHHFNAFSVSASILPLLAHLAARTTRIALGAGALLLPFHDPLRVAEDLATIDALSGGRLLLGVGRGGPFPEQFRNFGINPDDSRDRLFEGLALVEKLLDDTAVDHAGKHYQHENLSVFPRPVRRSLPTWLASLNEDSLQLAARRGYGLMGASAAPVARLREALTRYYSLAPLAPRPFIVARYLLCAPQDAPARAEAMPFIRDFGANMRSVMQRFPAPPALQPFGQEAGAFADDSLLANAIVGDPAACIDQCLMLQAELGPHILLLKPASYDPASNRRSLTLFAERVRPSL